MKNKPINKKMIQAYIKLKYYYKNYKKIRANLK